MVIPIPYKIVEGNEDSLVAFLAGHPEPLLATETHPNWSKIVAAAEAGQTEGFADLFDVEAAIANSFRRLSERVAVRGGKVLLDGDPVHGTLEDQILAFLDSGEDFAPLVNFYEKLVTNPLGDVREGLFDWIAGRQGDVDAGRVTITSEGNLLGYKSVSSVTLKNGSTAYRPSRASQHGGDQVNGVEVKAGAYIEQTPGDVVEMPRSKVLHAPSALCGDGLHIGTWDYAKSFSGNTVLLVEFSPRDIVSLPDGSASYKLRVCRYTVIKPVDGPLDTPLYKTAAEAPQSVRTATQPEPSVAFGTDRLGRTYRKGGPGRPGSRRGAGGRFIREA